jgi:hypothetical protein
LERYEAPKARSLSYSLSTRREYLPNQLLEEQMVQSPGSSPPSGNKKPKKQRVKRAPPSSESLVMKVADLQQENERLTKRLGEAEQKLMRIKASGWDERHIVKLRALEHFYSRVLNAQTSCKEDKAYLDELTQDVRHIIKDRLTKVGY